MTTYTALRGLPATAYLSPERFSTPFDTFPENVARGYAAQQYATGLAYSTEWDEVGISANGTWYASRDNGRGLMTSYEGIGYHACTADLLRGLLDGTARVVVYRQDGAHVIKERTR